MHIWTISDDAASRLRASFLALAVACAGLASGPVSAQSSYTGNFDLALSARVVSDGCFAGDTCTIGVAITNFGPDTFDGALRLRGRFQGNIRAVLTSIGPSGWTCNQASRDTVCTYRAGGIRPGRTLILETAYDLPTGLPVYDLTYCADIEWDGRQGGEPSVADIQRALAARGYNPGPVDGVPGFGTRNAIQQFQSDNGLEVTGWPTPEFNERLFSGAGYAGDNQPDNDRSCTSIADSGSTLDRTAPDDGSTDELPPVDDDASTEEEFAPSTDEDTGPPDEDAAEPGRDAGPEEPARLPRVHTPAPAPRDHNKPLSSFHETYRSGLHDKVLSQARTDDDTPDTAPRTPSRRTPDAAPRTPDPVPPAPDPVPQAPIHGKQTSEFHRKQLSTQHEKATSGAVVESQPLDPVTSDRPGGDDDWKAEFHQKYKSVQHKKDTSTLQDVHTKAISRVVHSKARSVITNPQFQGEIHDKALSAFHKKFRSQSHDKATSQASRSGSQTQ
jgi:peptidoglycan hydrolase-like protein with peptidoglycan-binding domain